jgi:hypothetical protein
LVMRIGVGDGLGPIIGAGDGDGVCASDLNGALVTAIAAAPAAGRTLTKLRRLMDVRFDFFMLCNANCSFAMLVSEKAR